MLVVRTGRRLLAAMLTIFSALLLAGVTAPAASAVTYTPPTGTATISGTVSAPPAAIQSGIYADATGPGGWQWHGQKVNSDGTYQFPDVPAGNVIVYFEGSYVDANNRYVTLEAKTAVLSVDSGQALTGVNVTMAPAATITGTVNLPAGINPNTIDVLAFDAAGYGTSHIQFSPLTNNGYSLNLPAGSYKLMFYNADYWDSNTGTNVQGTLVTQWYNNKTSFASADPLTVTSGQSLAAPGTTTMVQGATITGTVGPSTAQYSCIGAFPANVAAPAATTFASQSRTAGPIAKPASASVGCAPLEWLDQFVPFSGLKADGTYTITRVPAGSIQVKAIPGPDWSTSSNGQYAPQPFVGQWYSGKILRSTSVAVPVTLGQTVTGIDFTMRPDVSFTDVPVGTQFHDEITWLGSTGVSTGYPNGDGTNSYHPLSSVNRDAMAAFMYRLAGSPAYTAPAVSPFTDITPTTQFYKEITWLNSIKISTGYANGDGTYSYHPLSPVNRDAMAAFLYRFAGTPAFTAPATSPFTDVATNNPFYKEITWLAGTGISTGWTQPDGTRTFQPVTAVARDAMAAFMDRYQAMDAQK